MSTSSPTDDNPPPGPGPSKGDLIRRGTYKTNVAGVLTFVGLRGLEPLLQYQLLRPGGWGTALLTRLNLSAIPSSALPLATLFGTTLSLPLPNLVLVSMSAAASLKQIFWLLAIGREELGPGASAAVGIFNGAFNSLNALLFLWSATSPFSSFSTSLGLPLPAPMLAGTALFTLGIALETLPEIQRKRFKENPANKGKVCDAGVWGWVRHPNYGGYALWRTGYALAAGGLAFGLVMGAWQMWHFATDSVVFMDEYMQKRYGEQWEGHKKRVRWLLVPGIY